MNQYFATPLRPSSTFKVGSTTKLDTTQKSRQEAILEHDGYRMIFDFPKMHSAFIGC